MNALERHVLRLIGENVTTPDVFVDTSAGLAQIRDSLNDAIQELCMTTGHYRKKYLLTCLAERPIYRLEPQIDYVGCVISVFDRSTHRTLNQTDLTAIRLTDEGFLSTTGSPQWYYPIGWEHIGFYPVPGADGRILELTTIAVPKPYTHGTGPITLRQQYQRAAVYRAASDYYASRGDAKRASDEFQRYLEVANLMVLNPVGTEFPHRFRRDMK